MYKKSQKIIESFLDKYEFDDEEIDKLCYLANSSNSEIRSKVAAILGGVSGEKVEDTLYSLSFDKDNIVKLEAIDSLAIGESFLSLQRLQQICSDEDPYFRFFGFQSYCDVFLNRFSQSRKEELLNVLKEYEKQETDSLVLAAIYKCKAICGDKQSVFNLMQMHTKADEQSNYHLLTPVFNLLSELLDCLENEDTLKVIEEYLHRYENEE